MFTIAAKVNEYSSAVYIKEIRLAMIMASVICAHMIDFAGSVT